MLLSVSSVPQKPNRASGLWDSHSGTLGNALQEGSGPSRGGKREGEVEGTLVLPPAFAEELQSVAFQVRASAAWGQALAGWESPFAD